MQLQVFSIFATLLAAAQAAPVAFRQEARKSVNDCGDSAFVNQPSGDSPRSATSSKSLATLPVHPPFHPPIQLTH
jgi:hypothetical protein